LFYCFLFIEKILNVKQKKCNNCRRSVVSSVAGNISYEPITKFSMRKKLCCFVRPQSPYIWICEQCSKTLDRSTKKMNWSYIWPSFFWKLMSDNTKYLSNIWKWIPQNWRLMWIGMREHHPMLCANLIIIDCNMGSLVYCMVLEESGRYNTYIMLSRTSNLSSDTSLLYHWFFPA